MAVTLRMAAAAALVAICIAGITWETNRWILHGQKGSLEQRTVDVILHGNPVARARFARTSLDRLALRHFYPLDIDLRLEAAAAYRLLGDLESAHTEYAAALRVSNRPEIHVAFGDLLVEMGQTEAALDQYAYAVQFSIYYARHIRHYAREVVERVQQWDQQSTERGGDSGAAPPSRP